MANPGIHQDASSIPNMGSGGPTDGTAAQFWVDSSGSNYSIFDWDSKIRDSVGRNNFAKQSHSSMTGFPSMVTTRPTATSLLVGIKY